MSPPIIGITGYADQSTRPPSVRVVAIARTCVRAISLRRLFETLVEAAPS